MTEKKAMSKKSVNSNKIPGPTSGGPVPFQAKVIGAVLLLAFVGCTIFWFVTKSKLESIEASLTKSFEEKGFVIEKEPMTFSGFPFSVKAKLPKLKITRGDGNGMSIMIQGEPVELSISPWRPGRITLTGPLTYGAYAGTTPVLSLKVERVQAHVTLSKDSKAEVSNLKLYEAGILKGEGEKVVSVAEIAVKHEEKADGDLTKLMGSFELENIDFSASSIPVVLEKASLEGSLSTPYKTNDELMVAAQSFNKTFNEDLRKRCDEKAEYMPPLKVLMHAIEDTKSNFTTQLKLKGSDYAVALKLDGSVQDAFPRLILEINLKNVDKFLDSVVETGLLSPAMARASTVFLANVGEFNEKANERHIEIRLENKILKMGEKTLFEFKDFNWDEIKLPVAYCSYLDKVAEKPVVEAEESLAGGLVGLTPPVA
jgi:hypothetical protein